MWSAHRITEKQKAGKARNIKEKQLKNSRSTASRQHVVLLSSASAKFLLAGLCNKFIQPPGSFASRAVFNWETAKPVSVWMPAFCVAWAWLSVWVFPQASDSDGEHGSARGKADERYRGEEADFPVKKQDERESKPENTVNHQHKRDMAALPQDFCMVNAAYHEQKGGGQADQAEAGGVVGISKREQYAADQRAEHKEHENLWLKQTMKHDSIPPG